MDLPWLMALVAFFAAGRAALPLIERLRGEEGPWTAS